jgi:hypothetical protein
MFKRKKGEPEKIDCPICGKKVSIKLSECPECGEELSDYLFIEPEEAFDRRTRKLYTIGLFIFTIGALVAVYSLLHDALGLHGITTAPGYTHYEEFGVLNWLLVYISIIPIVVGIIMLICAIKKISIPFPTISEKEKKPVKKEKKRKKK